MALPCADPSDEGGFGELQGPYANVRSFQVHLTGKNCSSMAKSKGRYISFIVVTFLAMMQPLVSFSQSTRVRGRVTDSSGEGIPFAAVFFKGTTTGVSTDMDGRYTLETRDTSMTVLRAEILGYNPRERS